MRDSAAVVRAQSICRLACPYPSCVAYVQGPHSRPIWKILQSELHGQPALISHAPASRRLPPRVAPLIVRTVGPCSETYRHFDSKQPRTRSCNFGIFGCSDGRGNGARQCCSSSLCFDPSLKVCNWCSAVKCGSGSHLHFPSSPF